MGRTTTIKTPEQITNIAKHHGCFFVRTGPCANSAHRQTEKHCRALCRKGVLVYTGTSRQQDAHFSYVGEAGSVAAQAQAERVLKAKAKRKAALFTRTSALAHLRKNKGVVAISKKALSRRSNSLRSHLTELAKRGQVSIVDTKKGELRFHLVSDINDQ